MLHAQQERQERMAGTRRSLLAYWLLGYSLFIVIVGASLPSPIYELYRSA